MLFCYQKQSLTSTVEQRAAPSFHLKVNMSKSNIIVFRKGGNLGAREGWTYGSVVLPVVNVLSLIHI